jgi:hypothetical protein
MQPTNNLTDDVLAAIGGEPLTGSGFEAEQFELDFAQTQLPADATAAASE